MDTDERLDALCAEIESRSELLLRRIRQLERDLDDKISDAEYRMDAAMRRLQELERQVDRIR